jgi:hypothetical protein
LAVRNHRLARLDGICHDVILFQSCLYAQCFLSFASGNSPATAPAEFQRSRVIAVVRRFDAPRAALKCQRRSSPAPRRSSSSDARLLHLLTTGYGTKRT